MTESTPHPDTSSSESIIREHGPVAYGIELVIFASRWLLAPLYLGLVGGLVVLLIKFAKQLFLMFTTLGSTDSGQTIIGVLSLVDITLMGGLVLMVMFAGYENFISRLLVGSEAERPSWMGHVDFADLKLKLMASIVAISAIQLLESFMNIEHLSDRELGWTVGIHGTFVISAVLLSIMDRLTGKHG